MRGGGILKIIKLNFVQSHRCPLVWVESELQRGKHQSISLLEGKRHQST